jgi:hypothetical protein
MKGGPMFKGGHLMWLAIGVGVALLLIRTTTLLDGPAGITKN